MHVPSVWPAVYDNARPQALYKARKRRHELLSAHIAEDFPEGCGHSFDKNNISIVQAVAVYEGDAHAILVLNHPCTRPLLCSIAISLSCFTCSCPLGSCSSAFSPFCFHVAVILHPIHHNKKWDTL